jgi:hypothetical protein
MSDEPQGRPSDVNQLAAEIVKQATENESSDAEESAEENGANSSQEKPGDSTA